MMRRLWRFAENQVGRLWLGLVYLFRYIPLFFLITFSFNSTRQDGVPSVAVKYGDRASAYLAERGTSASLTLVGVLAAGFAGYLLWATARGRKNR